MDPEPDIETGLLAGPDSRALLAYTISQQPPNGYIDQEQALSVSTELSERDEKCWKPLLGFLYLLLIFAIIGIIIFAIIRVCQIA